MGKRTLDFGLAIGTLALLFSITGCVSSGSSSPKKSGSGGLLEKTMPGIFGGDKKEKSAPEEKPKDQAKTKPVPKEFPIGFVQMVPRGENFVLIRSGRAFKLEPGTELVTYNQQGKPTGKLSLSPERKGAFFVADITRGMPGKNDRVIAMGVVDPNSPTTNGLVPNGGFSGRGGDAQVLE